MKMRGAVLALACCLFTVAPVVAQTTPPVSTPVPQGQVASAISETNRLIEAQGATNATLIIISVGSVFFSISIIVLLGVVAWKFGLPLVNSNVSANQRADNSQKAMLEQSASVTATLARTADTNERTAIILSKLETKAEAEDGRSEAVNTINTHTDTVLKPIDGKLDTVVKALEEVKQDMVTAKRLDDVVNPLVQRTDQAIERTDKAIERIDWVIDAIHELQSQGVIVHKGDTGKLDPAKVPPTDPAARPDMPDDVPLTPDDASSSSLTPGVAR